MNKRIGFTLAEVLITLAIIGVVAVLTIPTLVANYQQRGWDTADKVFKRKLEESLKVMNTQGTLAGYRTTEAFVAELQKHLKITKVCKNDDLTSCFEDTVMFGAGEAEPEEVEIKTVKTAKNFGQDKWDTNVLGLQLANGTSALIAYNPECKQDPYSNQITGTSCVAILYDTSGYTKPNTSGKDLRNNNNVTKLGSSCAFEMGGTCYGAPFNPTPISKAECEELLGKDHCYYETDYWAGAIKQCGGVNKMPSQTQLDEIASYIYNTTVSSSGNTYATRDDEKASALGFEVNSGAFYVMSGEESSRSYEYGRFFGPRDTTRNFGYRNSNSGQAVCLGD